MSVQDTNGKSRTDWNKLEKMTDDEIDYSDIPPLSDDFFRRARLYLPQSHDLVQIEPDVLAWFKAPSSDYQAQINLILRQHINTQER